MPLWRGAERGSERRLETMTSGAMRGRDEQGGGGFGESQSSPVKENGKAQRGKQKGLKTFRIGKDFKNKPKFQEN